MQNTALVITRIRKILRIFLPKSWVSSPLAHDEGIYPRRPSAAEMEVEPGDPASSWVAWETSTRRVSRRPHSEKDDARQDGER